MWSVGNNWSNTATATTRYAVPPSAADRVLFQANAYPAGATLTVDTTSITIQNIIATNTAASINIVNSTNGYKNITCTSAATSTFGSSLSFPDETKAINFFFRANTTLNLDGTTEQYKGLYGISASGTAGNPITLSLNSNTVPPVLYYTLLGASGVSNGTGRLDLNNKFNTCAAANVENYGALINIKDNVLNLEPHKTNLSPAIGWTILSLGTLTHMPKFNYSIKSLFNDIPMIFFLNGNEVESLDINTGIVRFYGGSIINAMKLRNVNNIDIQNGGNVRFFSADFNDNIVLRNLTAGGSCNFSLGSSRTGLPLEPEYGVTGWDIKDVQSDSRNIEILNGTNGGNTAGFIFSSGPPSPLDENRLVTSTVEQILYGVVKVTKEKTNIATFTIEPIDFSVTTSTSTIGSREVSMNIGDILFEVSASGTNIKDEHRTVTTFVNNINFNVIATGSTPINETREVIAIVNPINFVVTARAGDKKKKYIAKVTVLENENISIKLKNHDSTIYLVRR